LHPPSLGELQLRIVTKEDQVQVTFFTETPQVKEIIENNLPQLRESFSQQGLKVEHFNVFVGNHPSGNQTEQQNEFYAIKTSQSVGKGQDNDGTPPLEGLKRWVLGNHRVDLFV
jgi:flagellar hook-length control protein FliK